MARGFASELNLTNRRLREALGYANFFYSLRRRNRSPIMILGAADHGGFSVMLDHYSALGPPSAFGCRYVDLARVGAI